MRRVISVVGVISILGWSSQMLGQSLSIVAVKAPDINCKFDPSCKIVVEDSVGQFALTAATGEGRLQSRTWPAGKPGTAGAGLTAYLYRIDLSSVVAVAAEACVSKLRLDFGSVAPVDYDGSGKPKDVFVIKEGGLGILGPTSAKKTGSTIVFSFANPVCPGSSPGTGVSSFFFGLASTQLPHTANAQITDTLGGVYTVSVRVP